MKKILGYIIIYSICVLPFFLLWVKFFGLIDALYYMGILLGGTAALIALIRLAFYLIDSE